MNYRKNSPQAQRFAERRRRENDAPRLLEQVPNLVALQMEIEDRSGVGGTTHTRRVQVDHAPALFLVPCGDPSQEKSFKGQDECRGSVGPSACSRVLHFEAVAEYRPG